MVVHVTGGHSMFSFIDRLIGYSQIKMHPHDAEKMVYRGQFLLYSRVV